MFLTEDEFLMG